MPRPLPHVVTALVATLAALALGTGSAAGTTTLRYVNLGDSYSAGSGVLPLAPGSNPLCTQAALNWAHDLASRTGAALTDVSCGGAKTSDFTSSQLPGVAPQLDAVSADTDLITMTIGGNDNNTFITAVAACGSAGLVTLGQGNPCQSIYGDSFANTIRTSTYPNVVNALKLVRTKAPHARVAISGYPWILPPTGGCYPFMPIAVGDVPYLRGLEATLNSVVAQAAADTGVTFVDESTVSEGHDACQPVGVRWIEPAFGTTQYVPVHPNALGERGMADQAAVVLHL